MGHAKRLFEGAKPIHGVPLYDQRYRFTISKTITIILVKQDIYLGVQPAYRFIDVYVFKRFWGIFYPRVIQSYTWLQFNQRKDLFVSGF